uniref:C-type lectin domain-containing protein n=2 Tax=Mesocestoides corti TaxID=53468 RepID=A0A5K3FAA0_MESCO
MNCTVMRMFSYSLGQWAEISCASKAHFVCNAKPVIVPAHADSHLHGDLFVQGRCVSGYYEYRSACYSLVNPPEGVVRSSELGRDGITAACEATAEVKNCTGNHVGGPFCPTVMSPHDLADAAFQRSLISKFGYPSTAAWVGLKTDYFHVYLDAPNFMESTSLLDYSLSQDPTNNITCVVLDMDKNLLSSQPCNSPLPALCGYFLDEHFLANNEVHDASALCPSGWKQFDSNCYRLDAVDGGLSWSQSEQACVAEGGHLASIHSDAEDEFIRSLLPNDKPVNPWIGLRVFNDVDGVGGTTMHWSDGSLVVYAQVFVTSQSIMEIDCFQLGSVLGHPKWTRAGGCSVKAPLICKAPVDVLVAEKDNPRKGHCQPGSQPEFCLIVNHTALAFVDAEAACQASGHSLTTILNDSQQDFLMRTLKQQNVTEHSRYWIGLHGLHGVPQWMSGFPAVPNVYWKTGVESSVKTCIYVDSSINSLLSWGTESCSQQYPFVCSKAPPSPPPPPPETPALDPGHVSCHPGFTLAGRKCYRVESDPQRNFTFAAAVDECRRSGGHLATVSSLNEQDILSVLLADHSLPAWIGLKATDQGHQWVTKEPIAYTNWMTGEPKWHANRNAVCAFMHSREADLGRWSEASCEQEMGFVCETEPTQTQSASVGPHLFSQGDCAPGFVHHKGACYQLLLHAASPSTARDAAALYDDVSTACAALSPLPLPCDKVRGLAGCPVTMTPHSQSEVAFMRLLIGQNPLIREAWVGLKVQSTSTLDIVQSEDLVALGNISLDLTAVFEHTRISAQADSVYTCFSLHRDAVFLSPRLCSSAVPAAICGYHLDTRPLHPQLTKSEDYACPGALIQAGGNCFYSATEKMAWFAAENFCANLAHSSSFSLEMDSHYSGHLPSVHDSNTLAFLAQMHGTQHSWLGLRTLRGFRGFNESWASSPLQWSDGSPVGYLAFAQGRPSLTDDVGRLGGCVALEPATHRWSDVSCDESLAFACQFPIEAFPKHQPASGNKYLATVEQCPSEFPLFTKSACYAVIEKPLSVKEALTECKNLNPKSSLASFHSIEEEMGLVSLLGERPQPAYWMGLSQSDLQYAWADTSVVDHIPKHRMPAETSHLWHFQDCFTFSPFVNTENSKTFITWNETDCNAKRPYICQVYIGARGPPSVEPAHPPPFGLAPIRCPRGYRQHEDRCFKFIPKAASFDDAEKACKEEVKGEPGFVGSLARISNSREQDFVSGLFSAEAPSQPSMAWIGLRGGQSHWTDGGEFTYSREGIDFPLSVTQDKEDMCTVMLYSSNIHFNGLWYRSPCSLNNQAYFVCQARATAEAHDPSTQSVASEAQPAAVCADGYTLGFFNSTAISLGSPSSLPHCLQLVSSAPMTWEEAHNLCKAQSASLPSIDTLADLSFLRSWLQTPRSLGGAGFTADAAVWLDLTVPECPKCYSQWKWHANESNMSPVRITDWFNAPTDSSGCYMFAVSPPSVSSKLRSIRPADSCTTTRLPVVCQTDARVLLGSAQSSAAESGIASVGSCVKNPTPELSSLPSFLTNVSVGKSGKPCIRWDLVQHNLDRPDALLPKHWRIFSAEIAYAIHQSPFSDNYCAHLAVNSRSSESGNPVYRYACYTSTDPETGLEDCEMESCQLADGSGGLSSGWIVAIMIFSLLFAAAAVVGMLYLLCGRRHDRFLHHHGRWVSPLKVTFSSSVFGGAPLQHRGFFYHSDRGENFENPLIPSVRMFDATTSSLITPNAPSHPAMSSLTLKNQLYRPLYDEDPLLLDEPDNADEFTGPV